MIVLVANFSGCEMLGSKYGYSVSFYYSQPFLYSSCNKSEMKMMKVTLLSHLNLSCIGKTATHAFVMCQLYTHDGQCHGLHGFVVPIRDPKTMLPFPGVTIFDMGEKIGKYVRMT
jgi:hypothetical protein